MGSKGSKQQQSNPEEDKQHAKEKFLKETVPELWTFKQTCKWLSFHDLDEFVPLFARFRVDGAALLVLTGDFLDANATQEEKELPRYTELMAVISALLEKETQSREILTKERGPPKAAEEYPDIELPADPAEAVMKYHIETCHTRNGSSRSMRRSWASQPKGFRRYYGAPFVSFPSASLAASTCSWEELHAGTPSVDVINARVLADYFHFGFALSAKKTIPGASWTKRVNPSSGGLHPVESYIVCPPGHELARNLDVPQECASVFHYCASDDGIELCRTLPAEDWANLATGLPENSVVFCLTSINWREVWKYGERAYRYCQLDVGHAIAAARYSAAVVGCTFACAQDCTDAGMDALLGLSQRQEAHAGESEFPACMFALCSATDSPTYTWTPVLPPSCSTDTLCGTANALSPFHSAVPIVDRVAVVCASTLDHTVSMDAGTLPLSSPIGGPSVKAGTVIRQRRSATSYERASMPSADFLGILQALMPTQALPWELFPAGRVHLAIYVNNVEDMPPGMYILPRSSADLRPEGHGADAWETTDIGGNVPLLRVRGTPEDEARTLSSETSCGQAIAEDCVFTVCMFCDLSLHLAEGAQEYRKLHYEAGVLGHALYLEAEARGFKGTGMGCYVDDMSHDVFFQESSSLQALYHFAVGVGSPDPYLAMIIDADSD